MMDYGMCQNCDEFFRGYCFCDGGPDEIIGEIAVCESYKERPQGNIRWVDKLSLKNNGDIIDFEGRVVGHIDSEIMKGGAE